MAQPGRTQKGLEVDGVVSVCGPVWPPGPPTETSGTTEPGTGTLTAADPVTARPLAVAEPHTGAGELRLCAREACHQPFQAVVGVRGRPRLYCSRSCTRAASNLRRTVQRRDA